MLEMVLSPPKTHEAYLPLSLSLVHASVNIGFITKTRFIEKTYYKDKL